MLRDDLGFFANCLSEFEFMSLLTFFLISLVFSKKTSTAERLELISLSIINNQLDIELKDRLFQ